MANPSVLDFDVLARIDDMQLLAKTVVEGFILGLHRSPYRGFSVEFAEYRQYSPGDEIKHIDWKVFGKTDRYYIKQFEEETNLACYIILDASGSMGYGSHETEKGDSPHLPERPGGCFAQMGTVPFFRRSKLRYGACMAACLAYFMLRQRDATGLMVFDSEVRTVLPPRGRQSHLKHILSELDSLKPGGETNIARPLHDLAEGMSRRGLIVLISDLIDDPAAVLSALQHFKFRGHDVIVFHLMDNAELTFPFDSLTEFSDLETGQKAMVTPEGIRPVYMEQLRQFLSAYEKGCAGIRADYKLFNTTKPLDLALSEYLYRRSQMG